GRGDLCGGFIVPIVARTSDAVSGTTDSSDAGKAFSRSRRSTHRQIGFGPASRLRRWLPPHDCLVFRVSLALQFPSHLKPMNIADGASETLLATPRGSWWPTYIPDI